MKTIQAAVAAYLKNALNVDAVEECSKVVHYPVFTVTVKESGTTVVAGGAMIEHSFAVTVRAAADREREGASVLLTQAVAALARGIPYTDGAGGKRVLHPLDMKTDGDKLAFALTVCALLPEDSGAGAATDNMAALHLTL